MRKLIAVAMMAASFILPSAFANDGGVALIFVKGINPGENVTESGVIAKGEELRPLAAVLPNVSVDQERAITLRSGLWNLSINCQTEHLAEEGGIEPLPVPQCKFYLYENSHNDNQRVMETDIDNRLFVAGPEDSAQMKQRIRVQSIEPLDHRPLRGTIHVYGGDARDLFYVLPSGTDYTDKALYGERRLHLQSGQQSVDVRCSYLRPVTTEYGDNMAFDTDVNWPSCTLAFAGL